MRPLLQNLVVCLATTALAASSYGAESLRWETDLQAAFQRSKVLNRPLLLHFFTTDCAPCRRLEQTVFTEPHVTAAMQDFFVPVKIDADQYPELAARYGITSVPHDVFVTHDDQELHRMTSPPQPEQYVAQLSAVAFRAGATRSANPVAAQPRPSGVDTSDRDRHWAESGYDPNRPDNRFNADAYQAHDRSPITSDRLAASSSGQASPRAATRDEQPEASPREVINRFARRGPDDQSNRAPATSEAPGETEIARQTEPAARESRQESWGDPAGTRRPSEASAESRSPLGDVDGRYATGQAERPPASRFSSLDSPSQEPSATPLSPAPNHATPQIPPLGLEGFCPVSLVRDSRWAKGDSRYGVIHRGRTYLFAGPDEKEAFFANPDDYSPVLAGIDPVELTTSGTTIVGQRAHGVVYRKRVYLFSSEANLQQFWEEPERYASPIRQAMETGDIGRLFR